MRTWIKGGQIVDPGSRIIQQADLLIERGLISRIMPAGEMPVEDSGIQILDATDKLIVPGLVDMHVHLREPGEEYKETVATGLQAAAAGGFTAVACMPNTNPANDCGAVTEFILEQARRAGLGQVYPVAAITAGRKGDSLTEFGDLKRAGARALSDDGSPVVRSDVMRRALEYARYHGLPVISHCEDPHLSGTGVMHEGRVSTEIGLPGIPGAGEDIMVYRDISLSRLTGCPVHIAHVSTAVSVELIKRAKEEGLPVTAETAPHYFTLDHGAVRGYDTRAKVNPPLRSPADVEGVRRGLAEGVLDVIATDHAPHSSLEKNVEFDKAAFGMIGLQTALPLALELVRQGVLGLMEAIAKLSFHPARILGVPGGELSLGSQADLALIDPDAEYVFEKSQILSKSKNTPFLGRTMKGRIEWTMVRGTLVWQRKS